jgi:hypothetical protein
VNREREDSEERRRERKKENLKERNYLLIFPSSCCLTQTKRERTEFERKIEREMLSNWRERWVPYIVKWTAQITLK